jgi:type VI protein secretion system component Hcp
LFAFAATCRTATRPAARRTRLLVEVLDGRVLPSATPLLAGALALPGKMQAAGAEARTKGPGLEKRMILVHHQAGNLHDLPTKAHNHAKNHKKKHGHSPTSLMGPLSQSVPVTPADSPSVNQQTGLPTTNGVLGPTTYTLTFQVDDTSKEGNDASIMHSSPSPIEVLSFQFESSNPPTSDLGTTGAGMGKTKLGAMDVTLAVGDYSPTLFHAATSGAHFQTVTLTEWKGNGTGSRVATNTWTMAFVVVSTDQIQGTSNGPADPIEEIQINYDALRESVATPGGKSGGNTVATWNQATNDNSWGTGQ